MEEIKIKKTKIKKEKIPKEKKEKKLGLNAVKKKI